MAFSKIRRPGLITVTCILGFIWMVLVLPGMFSPAVKKMGSYIPMVYGLILCLNFISLIGVWHMKRWGVELFSLTFFVKLSFFILTNQVDFSVYSGIFFSVMFMIVFLIYYAKMDQNL